MCKINCAYKIYYQAQGCYATPRGYAPLESTGNGCLRQTFIYCDSHESKPFSIVTPTRAHSEGKLQG